MASISSRARPEIWTLPDPPVALAGACCLSCVIAVLGNIPAAALALASGAAMLAAQLLARPAWAAAARRIMAVNAFVLFIWLIVPFTTSGRPLLEWGLLAPTAAGVSLCILVTLKANAILFVFMALIAPMPLSTFARSLAFLRCPERLVWLLLLMERNVHLLKREWRIIGDAAKLRAFAPRFNRRTYMTFGAMLAQLLLRAFDRGQRLREALLLAGFTGRLPHSVRLVRPLSDAVYGALIAALCLGLVFYG